MRPLYVWVCGGLVRNVDVLVYVQDICLPLINDERWEPDTLFLVFEEDFRFAADDDPEPQLMKAGRLQEVVGEIEVDDTERVLLDANNKEP